MIERLMRALFVQRRSTVAAWLLAAGLYAGPVFGQVSQAERDALIAIYNSTNGAGWTNNSGWLGEPGTECTWYGVGCGADPNAITSINLNDNGLVGSIPSSVGSLTQLTVLNFDANSLTGEIPSSIGNLTKLVQLQIGSNQLTGPIPETIGNLHDLVGIWLYNNNMSGALPSGIWTLSKLQFLRIHDNSFGGSIPSSIGNLTSLREFALASCGLSGPLPAELWTLTSLEEIWISANSLTGTIPASVGGLANLVSLSMSDNSIGGPIPRELGNLKQLRSLDLASNQLSGPIPVELGGLPQLEFMTLGGNQLEGVIPSELGNLTQLSSLYLWGCGLQGGIPTELGNLSNLRILYLGGNQLSGELPGSLGNLLPLEALRLEGNNLSGRIPSELGSLTQLEIFTLEGNQLIGPIPSALSALNRVTELNLSYNGLSPSTVAVKAWADSRQPDWQATQTVAPTNLQTTATTATSATLSWTPIMYTSDSGRYEVLATGAVVASTADKTANSATVSGLQPGSRYSFAVRTVTDRNGITSEPTPELAVMTTAAPSPNVTLTKAPEVITIVADGVAVGSTTIAIANLGNAPSDVTLTPAGAFFTLSNSVVTLQGGASSTVTVTALPRTEVAELRGSVGISGIGVPAGLSVEVKVFAAPAPPAGTPNVIVETTQVDVSAPAGVNPSGSVTFRNIGNARATGVLGSDQPWIVPEASIKVIEPAATGTFTFVIDRAKRPDANALAGSQLGTLSFVYVAGSGAGALGRSPLDGAPTLSTPITISDTVKPADKGSCAGICVNGIPLLADGEVGLVVPGIGSLSGPGGTFASDVSINNRGVSPLGDIALYFAGKAVEQPVGATTALALADVTNTAFDKPGEVGALHLRSTHALSLAMSASTVSRSEPSGTFGSAIPVFRTDRGATGGVPITITGVRKGSTATFRLYVQEVRGAEMSARIEFLDATGAAIGVVPARAVPAYGFTLVEENEIPDGVVTVRVKGSGAGAIVAYATVVDREGKDTSVVADWGQVYDYSETDAHVLAVAGAAPGRNGTYFRSSMALHALNAGSVTLTYFPLTPQVSPIQKVITLDQGETKSYDDVVEELFETSLPSIGYLAVTPAPGTRVKTASRTWTTKQGSSKTLGTGVPMLPEDSALHVGESVVFGGLEDSTFETAAAGRPATFRTNIGLAEVSGSAVKVRVSILLYDGRQLAVGGSTASRDYELAPHSWNQLNGIVDEIVGREVRQNTLGNLSNVQVRVQVVEGEGALVVYATQTDNGSGDTTIRFE